MGNNFRGLVISAPVRAIDGGILHEGILDPQELRFALLFWDRLDYPTTGPFRVSCDSSEALEQMGVLERSVVGSPDLLEVDEDTLSRLHLEAYRRLESVNPGCWSLGRGERSFDLPVDELSEDCGLLVTLNRVIPIPNQDVPYQDILDFREKRRSELLAMRYHLDGLFSKISNAGNGAFALNSEIQWLEESVSAILRTAGERKMRMSMSNIDVGLDLTAGVAAFGAALKSGAPLLEAALNGGAAAILAQIGASLKRGAASQTPFQYVISYHREVFA